MENNNKLLEDYNPLEEKRLQKQRREKAKKKKQKVILTWVLTAFIVLVVFVSTYLLLDVSKVKSLVVKGNFYLSDEYVLEMVGINYDSRYVLVIPIVSEYQLSRSPFIKSAKVKHLSENGIEIEIVEEKGIGYYYEKDSVYIVLDSGKAVEVASECKHCFVNLPLIVDDTGKEDLIILASGLAKVSNKVLANVSEIWRYTSSYDKHMYRFLMVDGNQVFSTSNSLPLLTNYLDILKNLTRAKACLVLDAPTETAYTKNCDSLNAEEKAALNNDSKGDETPTDTSEEETSPVEENSGE